LDIICIDISFIIVYSKRGVDIAWPRQNYTFIRADRAWVWWMHMHIH